MDPCPPKRPSVQTTENDWPGATPPAGWFLRSPANAQAARPPADTSGTGSDAGKPDAGPTQPSPTQPSPTQP